MVGPREMANSITEARNLQHEPESKKVVLESKKILKQINTQNNGGISKGCSSYLKEFPIAETI